MRIREIAEEAARNRRNVLLGPAAAVAADFHILGLRASTLSSWAMKTLKASLVCKYADNEAVERRLGTE